MRELEILSQTLVHEDVGLRSQHLGHKHRPRCPLVVVEAPATLFRIHVRCVVAVSCTTCVDEDAAERVRGTHFERELQVEGQVSVVLLPGAVIVPNPPFQMQEKTGGARWISTCFSRRSTAPQ